MWEERLPMMSTIAFKNAKTIMNALGSLLTLLPQFACCSVIVPNLTSPSAQAALPVRSNAILNKNVTNGKNL